MMRAADVGGVRIGSAAAKVRTDGLLCSMSIPEGRQLRAEGNEAQRGTESFDAAEARKKLLRAQNSDCCIKDQCPFRPSFLIAAASARRAFR